MGPPEKGDRHPSLFRHDAGECLALPYLSARRLGASYQREVVGTIRGCSMAKFAQDRAVLDHEHTRQLAQHLHGLHAKAVRQRAKGAAGPYARRDQRLRVRSSQAERAVVGQLWITDDDDVVKTILREPWRGFGWRAAVHDGDLRAFGSNVRFDGGHISHRFTAEGAAKRAQKHDERGSVRIE